MESTLESTTRRPTMQESSHEMAGPQRQAGNQQVQAGNQQRQTWNQREQAWKMLAAAAPVPLGLATAAALTSYVSKSDKVGTAAWVATAIVGTASIIASAAAARRIYD